MPTECISDLFGFARVEGRAVVAAFDGGAIICPLSPRLMASKCCCQDGRNELRTERPEGEATGAVKVWPSSHGAASAVTGFRSFFVRICSTWPIC